MAITRWNPNSNLPTLREMMDRFFEDAWLRPGRFFGLTDGARVLPLDVHEKGNELVVRAEVPGVRPEDVKISVRDGALTIKVTTSHQEEEDKQYWHYRELYRGEQSRTISLPAGVEPDKAKAGFENGVLTVTIPKPDEGKPREIEIKVKALEVGKE